MLLDLLDRGLVPLPLLRRGVRRLLAARLLACNAAGEAGLEAFLAAKRIGPIARHTAAANAQHYEVPAAFHRLTLGPRMKYSGGYWASPDTDLASSETAMLDLSIERAGIADGQRVLDLGCGWGALTIRLLERFPNCEVVALSNSNSQRAHILAEVERRDLRPPVVWTEDVNAFAPKGTFDRVISVEMFEHLWNHEALLEGIAAILRPKGELFLHVFAHRRFAYPFEDRGPSDWMARQFFTGGWMPSHDSFARGSGPLAIVESWEVDGTHYARTARAWRQNLERRRSDAGPVLESTYGRGEARRWFHRWRLFFLACEELWGYRGGTEWIVSHHRLEPRARRA